MARQGNNARGGNTARGGGGGGGASGGSASAIRAGGAFVELFAKDSALDRGLKNASKKLQDWGKSTAKAGAAAIAGGAAILTPIALAIKNVTDRGVELSRIAQVYGDTVENISALQFAADMSGAGAERLQQAMENLPERIYDAVNGSGELNAEFAKLGVSAFDLVNKPFTEQLLAMADGFGKLDTATKRAGIASKLFSDVGLEGMIPLLAGGRAQLQGWLDQAKQVGAVLTKEQADKQVAVSKDILLVWTSVKSIYYELTNARIEFINANPAFVNAIVNALKNVRLFISENKSLALAIVGIGTAILVTGGILVGLSVFMKSLVFALLGVQAAITVFVSGVKLIGSAFAFVAASPFLATLAVIGVTLVGLSIAWFKFSDAGKEVLQTLTDTYYSFIEAIKTGDLKLAGQIAFAGLKLSWLEATNGLKMIWIDFVKFIKDKLIDVGEITGNTIDTLALGYASIFEKLGIAPEGTARTIFEDTQREQKENEKKRQDALQQNDLDRFNAIKKANYELLTAQLAFDEVKEKIQKRAVVVGGAGALPKPDLPATEIGTRTLGAFGFGNASQFFGGTTTFGIMQKQLNVLEKINTAVRTMPLLRIR